MSGWLEKIKQQRPMVISKDKFESTVKAAVEDAVLAESKWGEHRREHGDSGVRPNDPFGVLQADPFDRSSFYQESGQFVIPKSDVHLRKELKALKGSRLKSAIESLGNLISSATAGWLKVGEAEFSRGLSSREIIPEQLFLAQDAAVLKVRSDPHARGIVNNLQFYTIGKGVTWGTPSIEVTKFLTKFRQMNRMELRERTMVKEIYQEGEYFWVYFLDLDTGLIKIRKWRPKEITEIETHKQDVEARLAYHREAVFAKEPDDDKWYQDINYDVQFAEFDGQASENTLQPNIFIQMSKYGDLDQLRGWPPMYSTLRWFKYLDDFIVDRARLHHEQSKVIWFQQRKGSASRKGTGGTAINPLLAPKGGSMWTEDDSVSYRQSSPDLHGGDAERDALLLIYAISSGNCQPMHVWNQRSDQSNYASIRKADTPFSQSINANQTFLTEEWEERDMFVVRQGVKSGALPEEVSIIAHDDDLMIRSLQKINEMVTDGQDENAIIKEATDILAPGMHKAKVKTVDIEITRTFPDVVQEAPLDMAKVLLIHQKMGIVSDATLSVKAGYDWHEELLRRFQEAKQKASLEAGEMGELEKAKKALGLPNQIDQFKIDKKAAEAPKPEVEPGTPGGGRAPGDGAGTTKVSRDDLSAGGKAKTDVPVKKTE